MKSRIYQLLKWSETYTKVDMVYSVKGGFWLTLKQFVVSTLSILLAITFANLLPKETYGNYKYIMAFVGVLTLFSLSGMFPAVVQSVARGFEGTFFLATKTRIKWGFVGMFVGLALSGYYYVKNDTPLAIGFAVSSLFIPFIESLLTYDALLVGRKNFRDSAIFQITSHGISIGLLITTLFLTKNLFLIILVYFVSYSVIRALFLCLTLKKLPHNQETDPSVLSYGKHLSLMDVVRVVAKYIDKILVFNYLGAAELAIYIFAISPPDCISGFLSNIRTLALPKYSQGDKNKTKKGMTRKMVLLGSVILLITLIYIATCSVIYKLIFPLYLESILYTKIFSISLVTAVGTLPLSLIQGQKNIKALYRYNIVAPFLNIIMLLVAIQFGLGGMIIGRVANRFINLIYLTYLAKR